MLRSTRRSQVQVSNVKILTLILYLFLGRGVAMEQWKTALHVKEIGENLAHGINREEL